MHEVGIAEATLIAIEKEVARCPGTRAVRASMRIGELAGVDPAALRFAFEAIVQGTEFETLQLEIESLPRKEVCTGCSHEFLVRNYDLQCPKCRGRQTTCIGGEELDLAFVEVEEYAAS
jgi:hydrogenase nickel incorporation protein HypA/HybF